MHVALYQKNAKKKYGHYEWGRKDQISTKWNYEAG